MLSYSTKQDNVSGTSVFEVVLKRPLAGETKEHYTFDPQGGTIDVIAAMGSNSKQGEHYSGDCGGGAGYGCYHGAQQKTKGTLAISRGTSLCVCRQGCGVSTTQPTTTQPNTTQQTTTRPTTMRPTTTRPDYTNTPGRTVMITQADTAGGSGYEWTMSSTTVGVVGTGSAFQTLTLMEGDVVTYSGNPSATHWFALENTAAPGTLLAGTKGTGSNALNGKAYTYGPWTATKGTYTYFCPPHAGFMKGTINVVSRSESCARECAPDIRLRRWRRGLS